MSELEVVPIPLWRNSRRTAVLLVILGALVVLFGVGLYLESLDLEDSELSRLSDLRPSPPSPPPPPAPAGPSASSPPTTSS